MKSRIVHRIKIKKLIKKYEDHIKKGSLFVILLFLAIVLYSTGVYWNFIYKGAHFQTLDRENNKQQLDSELLKKIQHSSFEVIERDKGRVSNQNEGPETIGEPEILPLDELEKLEQQDPEKTGEPTREITKNDLLGKIDPSTDSRFIRVPQKYLVYKNSGMYLRSEVWNAFHSMAKAANHDGIDIRVASGLRKFRQQKDIWQSKWDGIKKTQFGYLSDTMTDREKVTSILVYSAMPGTSRHHWGTEVDINSVSPYYFTTDEGQKVFEWLKRNAHEYGFCQTYTKDNPVGEGYRTEPWHWSYVPLSRKFLEKYKQEIANSDIQGFPGSGLAQELNTIENYVLNIDESCK